MNDHRKIPCSMCGDRWLPSSLAALSAEIRVSSLDYHSQTQVLCVVCPDCLEDTGIGGLLDTLQDRDESRLDAYWVAITKAIAKATAQIQAANSSSTERNPKHA